MTIVVVMLLLRRTSLNLPAIARRWCHANSSKLPEHIKIRMIDVDFTQTVEGSKLNRWFAEEGKKIGPGTPFCEIETPELLFSLESEDEGYLAKIFVPEQADHIRPNQVLAALVPNEEDIAPFLAALAENPNEIEEYKPSSQAAATTPAEPTDGADLLRVLSQLNKEGAFPSEAVYKTLKSLARKNDEELLRVYKGSFQEDNTTSAFDKEFFVENCLDLVDEKTP
ncbi:unnamed protein product [Aphanomyces euteiches]